MPHPIIIDTDPGVDDVLSILLALASPEVKLEAITVTFGNTTVDYGHANVLRTGAILREHLDAPTTSAADRARFAAFAPDAPPIQVAVGAEKPIGGRMFTAGYFHGRDGLSSISSLPEYAAPSTPPAPLVPSSLKSPELILEILRNHPPGTVTIAAVGPLTNLALAWETDPQAFARVGCIAAMGGALDVPGNTSSTAEFNFFADPWAAKLLLEYAPTSPVLGGRGLPFALLPLDITHQHCVPYSRLVSESPDASRLHKYISAFLARPRQVTNTLAPPEGETSNDLFVAHDPLAVAYAIFNDPSLSPTSGSRAGWKTTLRKFRMETDGKLTRGMCVVDRRNHGTSTREGAEGRNRAEDDPDSTHDADPTLAPTHAAVPATSTQNGNDNTNGLATASKVALEEERAKHQAVGEGAASGTVHVVTTTPGSEWFAETFLGRLGL